MKTIFRQYEKQIIGFGFIMLICFGIYSNSKEEHELIKYGKATEAVIIDFKYVNKASYSIKYKYYVDGEKYLSSRKVSFF